MPLKQWLLAPLLVEPALPGTADQSYADGLRVKQQVGRCRPSPSLEPSSPLLLSILAAEGRAGSEPLSSSSPSNRPAAPDVRLSSVATKLRKPRRQDLLIAFYATSAAHARAASSVVAAANMATTSTAPAAINNSGRQQL